MDEHRNNKFVIIGTIVLLIILANTIKAVIDKKSSLGRIETARAELENWKNSNKDLEEKLQFTQTEEYLEKAALEELNMTKPEYQILVMEGQPTFYEKEYAENNPSNSIPNWKLWIQTFNFSSNL